MAQWKTGPGAGTFLASSPTGASHASDCDPRHATHAPGGSGQPGAPQPWLVGLLLYPAGPGLRFHRQVSQPARARTGEGLDGERSRQGLHALAEQTQQPLARDAPGAAEASERNPLHQHAFAQTTLVIREAVWLAVRDALAPTVVAVMVLGVMVKVPMLLVRGGLARRAPLRG